MNDMKENKNAGADAPIKVKRRSLYYILVTACALVLAAAIVLIVVFATNPASPTLDDPGATEQPDDPSGGTDDTDDTDDAGDTDDTEEPDEPSGTEVVFSMPVSEGTLGTAYTFWYNSTLNRYNLHTGVDFKADAGTAVAAAYAGTVESVTDTLLEGGKVVIDHGNGLRTVYASIDPAAGLAAGDTVARGDVIGAVSAAADVMGNEYDEGSHLHFEVTQDGKAIDPVTYLDLSEK